MKIRVTEPKIKLNVNDKLREFVEGDEVTVEDKIGEMCCGFGWAVDIDNVVPTGIRKPGANGPIKPATVKQKIS